MTKPTDFDQWTTPLSSAQIQELKDRWQREVGSLELATCYECKLQKENRCNLQWDHYNTQGDCLYDK